VSIRRLIALTLLAAPVAAPAQDAAFFETKVRPVLVEKCAGCHGEKKQEMGLRLDTAAGFRKGSDAGPVVEPGKPDESALIEAIRHEGPVKMPPDGKLPDAAIADLSEWVRQGAPWPETLTDSHAPADAATHWAFQRVVRPAIPRTQGAAENPIDRFVLSRLEAAGLTLAPEADRRTLIRRLTFDITGLPPSPERVEAFLADDRPEAYERLVDELLASPRYGERWGRHWLDVARYADTKGYVFFEDAAYPWAWTYRDYVIESLNEDRPFDRFVTEQIAADRLDLGADRRPLRAVGFLTVGGRFMGNVHDVLDDRIDVVTRGLMGLTVGCARCHDHKYDPIPQADYYALYGVFASSVEPDTPPLYEEPEPTETYMAFRAELERRQASLTDFVRAKRAELTGSAQRRVGEYLLAAHARRKQPSTESFMLLADGDDLNPTIASRWHAALERARRAHHPVLAPWLAVEDVADEVFASEAPALLEKVVISGPPVNELLARTLREEPPASRDDLARLYGRVLNRVEGIWVEHRARTAAAGRPAEGLPDPVLEELRRVFHGLEAPSDIALLDYGDLDLLPDRPSQEELKKLQGAVEEWRKTGPGAPPRAMVLEDRPEPVEPRVFLRGNPNRPGDRVDRRAPSVVTNGTPRPFQDGSGRLELARAIVDPANPLTARVLVNRVWMHHLGAPLVATPSDFGLRGEPPTHPELLDWLAASLIEDGWSLKRLHRLILTSRAYRQAAVHPAAEAADPENRLLGRANRRRLDFESLRDALLLASGRLDPRVGGPSVPDVGDPANTRRTLYASIDRLNLPLVYRTFDFPDPNTSAPRRDPTTVPPQALFLLNHPIVLESARALAARSAAETSSERRVDALYRALFQRPPTDGERAAAVAFAAAEPPAVAWERLAHALLLTNEFLFVE
jgi:mono/diheme cytochrome c family protein